MTRGPARLGITSDEQRRLEECAREEIRTPGAIQSHGALVGIDRATFVVDVASENCQTMLGLDASPLGLALDDLTGVGFARTVREFVEDRHASNPLSFETAHEKFDVVVHEAHGLVLLEFEPVLPRSLQRQTSALYELIHRVARSTDVDELRRLAARELRWLTGFDRVMIYEFYPDGHGEVVAEARADDMEPYIGLHFPASDIPAQARELYLTKLSRAIVGASGDNQDLRTRAGALAQDGLDLSGAELRSVSPHHLQFMRNMGQDSTLSFSMVRDGALIGMITCAHRSLLRLPFIMRRGIEVLASQIALQVSAIDQVQRLRRQATVRDRRSELMGQVAGTVDIADVLVHGRMTALDVIAADGVAARIDGRTRTSGMAPPSAELDALAAHLHPGPLNIVFATDALGLEHPDIAALAPTVTGVLMVSVGGSGDYLAFFRNEVLRTVNWLGDQTTANRQTPLSPRNSFSSWSASVTGTATPWDDLVVEAVELARDLESTMLRKVESQLASLASRDAMTGLPNRRGLMLELEARLESAPSEDAVSLLFIDIDGFKNVNDRHGHDVGDHLIIAVGRRIEQSTRARDYVARLGGDEFVVLCDGAAQEDAIIVAERIRTAIEEPFDLGDVVVSVTVSVGAATAERPGTAAEALRLADQAMYRAKDAGKNRTSE